MVVYVLLLVWGHALYQYTCTCPLYNLLITLGAYLRLQMTVCIKKFSQIAKCLCLDKGNSYEAETKVKYS